MNAYLGIARATFRLKGTLLYWIFCAVMALFAVAIGSWSPVAGAAMVAVICLSLASWMGWFLFLQRLWQLQRHAEALQLPGARRRHETATLLIGLLGTGIPAVLLTAIGAEFQQAWLAMLLSLSTAGLYLMIRAATGVGLIILSVLIPGAVKLFPALGSFMQQHDIGLQYLLAACSLLISVRRWRSTMQVNGDTGWNVPQIVQLTRHGGIDVKADRDDPARHWMSTQVSDLTHRVGPNTPVRSLAILLCGSMAPVGWRSYLRGASWMSAAIVLLALLAMSNEDSSKGPGFGLLILLSIWALAIPATLITRLRQEWAGDGQALAEAFLLPGLVKPQFSWLQVMAAALYTSVYRLSLPALLVFAALSLISGSVAVSGPAVLVASWAMLLSISLLPLAQRQGGLATFALYALLGLIVITVIAVHVWAASHGFWPIPLILPITTGVVLLAAALGGLLPRSQSPFAISAS